VPDFTPEQLADWTGGRWTARPAAALTGFATDTRELRRGQAFVALRTDRRDGHDFLGAALAAGAGAAIVATPDPAAALPQLVVADPLAAFQAVARAHRREFAGPVIGITGSAGKTSTKNLLALLLGDAVLATVGNLNNHLGVPLTLTRLDPARHRYAVIEAGISAPGEMAVLADMIEPDFAVVTLVAPAHLAGLGGLEGVAREKAVLAAAVRPGGMAFFPPGCAAFAAFRGLKTPAVVVAGTVAHDGASTRITLAAEAAPFRLPRVSEGMAQNAALALSVAQRLGVAPGLLRSRLEQWRPAPLRGELRREGGRLLYLDCYNANPASMADALAAFAALAPAGAPRLYVIGGMEELGAAAEIFHRELGRGLHLGPDDFMFVLGGNAGAVRDGAIEGGSRAAQVAVVDALDPVAERLAGWRGAVFIKGSRRYQLERLLDASSTPAPAH